MSLAFGYSSPGNLRDPLAEGLRLPVADFLYAARRSSAALAVSGPCPFAGSLQPLPGPPVTFHPHPAAAPLRPVPRDPGSILIRRFTPVPGFPHPIAMPLPMTGDPSMHRRGRRSHGFLLRRRRRHRNHWPRGAGREADRQQQHDAGPDQNISHRPHPLFRTSTICKISIPRRLAPVPITPPQRMDILHSRALTLFRPCALPLSQPHALPPCLIS
jgi:hypothetical protein